MTQGKWLGQHAAGGAHATLDEYGVLIMLHAIGLSTLSQSQDCGFGRREPLVDWI